MKLKLVYQRTARQPTVGVMLTVDHVATIGAIAEELVAVDPEGIGCCGDPLTLAVAPPGRERLTPLEPDRQVGEAELASGWTVAVVSAADRSQDIEVAAAVEIRTGPDAGKEMTLPQGTAVIGRDNSCDVVLDDPFVSKKHARLEIDTGIRLVDLNSANGIVVDGGVVSRLAVQPGQVVVLGDTEITMRRLGVAGSDRPIEGGVIPHNRSPRVEARFPERELPRPKVPSELEKQPFPWIMLVAPVLMGATMFAFTRSPMSLMFVVLGPLMIFGNFLMTRGRNKRKLADDIAKFEKQLDRLSETFARERPREQAIRQAEVPPVVEVYRAGHEVSALLWTRRPEHWSFLHVRFGSATLPSRLRVAAPGENDDGIPECSERLERLEERYRDVDGVPVVEDVLTAGALGVVGDGENAADALRGIVLQLVGLHSPAELVVTAMLGPSEVPEHEWLAWVPHTSSAQSPIEGTHLADSASTAQILLSELESLVDGRIGRDCAEPRGPLASRLAASSAGGTVGKEGNASAGAADMPLPFVVVLVSENAQVDRARVVQLSECAATAGILPIWVSARPEALPAVCRTYVDVSRGLSDTVVHFVRHGEVVGGVQYEGVSADDARAFALALAPLADAGAVAEDAADLPTAVPLVTLLGSDLADSEHAVVDRWRQNDSLHRRTGAPVRRQRVGTLRALVGQSSVDAMHLDLRSQGPHALVGGTTGSGKSEFLQAWVLGMAAECSPDRVTFLFVDYKGGAAFADCVNLPHCVGLVTDLSPHLVRRALTSLRAELHRRERLLNRKQVKDLLELEKRGDPESPPSLVLVIDEFAALATEVPEFVDGVVDIAQRGRSLGIHLIMATQRPAGVIKDNLRANTNLRVALRMADEADSSDVIGSPEAAGFDPSVPGRGVVKTGPGRLMAFQSAYAGGRTVAETPEPSITVHSLGFGAPRVWERPADAVPPVEEDAGPTDQQRLVSTISRAAAAADVPQPRRPWLEELRRAYDLSLLDPPTGANLILGVADLPRRQAQELVHFRPDVDGNLAVYGTGGSGKSVVLRTLAAGAGLTPRGGPVHVYALDFSSGGLRMLEALPHVGAVIAGDDTDRVARLLRTLRDLAEKRARTFPTYDAGSIVEYREAAGKPDEPRIVLLIDGFPAFRDQWEVGAGRAEWYDAFQSLLGAGRALGIHVVFTADRPASVPGSVSSSVPRRVVLRLAEEGMYSVLDVPNDILSSGSPAGRAVVDDQETQIAILGGSGNVADQSQAMGRLGRSMERQGIVPAPTIKAMPEEIPATELPDEVDGQPVVGVSDIDLQPLGFEPEGTILISGGPQSGRSNAVAALASSVQRWDPDVHTIYFGNRRSRLPQQVAFDETLLDPHDVAERAKELADSIQDVTADRHLIVVESLPDFGSPPIDMPIAALANAVRRSDHLMIAEAESSTWTSSFPVYAEFKNARRGLLLQPDTMEGDAILRTSIPRVVRSEFPPGRGYWIAGGKAVRVQIPLAPGGIHRRGATSTPAVSDDRVDSLVTVSGDRRAG